MIENLYTWSGVYNAILMNEIQCKSQENTATKYELKMAKEEATKLYEALDEREKQIVEKAVEDAKRSAKQEFDELASEFDDQMNQLTSSVEYLTAENERLNNENLWMKTKISTGDEVPLLQTGGESDLYPQEIKDILLTSLTDYLSELPSDSRRYHVISDIIQSNNFEGISNRKAEHLKLLLKSYDGMSATLKQELENMGIRVTGEGKHYKLTYYGDGRYQASISKTPSDFRSGKNCASEMVKKFF